MDRSSQGGLGCLVGPSRRSFSCCSRSRLQSPGPGPSAELPAGAAVGRFQPVLRVWCARVLWRYSPCATPAVPAALCRGTAWLSNHARYACSMMVAGNAAGLEWRPRDDSGYPPVLKLATCKVTFRTRSSQGAIFPGRADTMSAIARRFARTPRHTFAGSKRQPSYLPQHPVSVEWSVVLYFLPSRKDASVTVQCATGATSRGVSCSLNP